MMNCCVPKIYPSLGISKPKPCMQVCIKFLSITNSSSNSLHRDSCWRISKQIYMISEMSIFVTRPSIAFLKRSACKIRISVYLGIHNVYISWTHMYINIVCTYILTFLHLRVNVVCRLVLASLNAPPCWPHCNCCVPNKLTPASRCVTRAGL
jgi:hypothetical protein